MFTIIKTKECKKTRKQTKYMSDYIDEDLGMSIKIECKSDCEEELDVIGDLYFFINYPVEIPGVFKMSYDSPKIKHVDLLYYYTQAYQLMYKLEDIPTPNNSIRYGIWGHDLGELTYNGVVLVEYYKTATIFQLGYDS